MTALTLDITGGVTAELNIPVPEKVRLALAQEGVTAPAHLVLELCEAPLEELEELSKQEHLARVQSRPAEFMAELMMKRAQAGTDERLVRAMVQAMVPSAMAKITHACMYGKLPNA